MMLQKERKGNFILFLGNNLCGHTVAVTLPTIVTMDGNSTTSASFFLYFKRVF
jgi:hypothetical protein